MQADLSQSWGLAGAYSLTALLSYLVGSVSFAVLFSKLFKHEDVREHGSGNAGATNVFRTIGIGAGILTFICDFLKGVVAMLLGRAIYNFIVSPTPGSGIAEKSICVCIAGLFALLGHLYPAYFGFRGGKGVLTLAGIMLIISPVRLLCEVGIFILFLALTQTVSVGSCACAVGYPIVTFFCCLLLEHQKQPQVYSMKYVIVQTCIAMLFGGIVLFKHHANIKRIFDGTEPKITFKKD